MTPEIIPNSLTRDETRLIWERINFDWKLDFDMLVILKKALEFLERSMECAEILRKEGLTFLTESKQIKKHPLVEVQKVADAQFLMAWRMLNLGIEPPSGLTGRKPTGGGSV